MCVGIVCDRRKRRHTKGGIFGPASEGAPTSAGLRCGMQLCWVEFQTQNTIAFSEERSARLASPRGWSWMFSFLPSGSPSPVVPLGARCDRSTPMTPRQGGGGGGWERVRAGFSPCLRRRQRGERRGFGPTADGCRSPCCWSEPRAGLPKHPLLGGMSASRLGRRDHTRVRDRQTDPPPPVKSHRAPSRSIAAVHLLLGHSQRQLL